MARRSVIIGLFVVLAQLAMGCNHCGKFHKKHALKHQQYIDPSACSCASPSPVPSFSTEPPIFPAEQLPIPKKMPATTVTPIPQLTGLQR